MPRTLIFLALILRLATPSYAAAGLYDTYAAWGDKQEARHGHLYLYTGPAASTDYYLYNTGTPGTTINNLLQSQLGVGPYQPVTSFPSNEDSDPGFGNNYFKLRSTNPMTWEVDETTSCHCNDAHGMVASADNLNSYIGSIFMTYLRKDTDTETDGTIATLPMFGDHLGVLSASSITMTATIRKWNGAAWGPVIVTSPIIPAGGIWMWSPDQLSPPKSGGTLAANAGHYRVDMTGQGLLYKGNLFTPLYSRGAAWNRDNAMLVAPDRVTGQKIGTDLIGAVVSNGSTPQIIVTNQGSATATFQIMEFAPNTAGVAWPIDGSDPSGTWTVVATPAALAPGSSFYYTSPYNAFMRVVSTNGQLLNAIMGTALTRSRYVGGDYFYAQDTGQAIGKLFQWGGTLQNTTSGTPSDGPLEIHVVAPFGGSQVTVSVDGSISGANYFNQVQTTSGPDQGLKFNLDSSANQNIRITVTSNQYVYVWAASNTGSSSDLPGGRYGETFYSNPPIPRNLLVAQKSANPGTVTLNDTVTYVLTATNIGAANTLSVMIWDTVPPGMALQTSSPAPSYSAPPLYGWSLGTIPLLGSLSVTVTASVGTAFNGEVKHNTALVTGFAVPPAQSPDAPVRVLIPGADLQKSANVGTANPGDTVTYTINYINSAAALPATPRFDLKVKGSGYDANNINLNFEIDNYSGAPVNVSDFTIGYWLSESPLPGQITKNQYGGGNTTPYAGWGNPSWVGTVTSVSPAITRPDSRNANLQVLWNCTTVSSLPSGSKLDGINLDLSANSPAFWTPANNVSVNYSRRPADATYVEDSHYVLYYQGKLVSEYTDPTTPDASTGAEPQNWAGIYDTCPAEVTYLGSVPAALATGPAPFLSWFAPNVPPQASAAYTWWGTVKIGTAGGSVINNRALAQANTITVLSNLATVVVPVIGTFTNTPTATPTFSATPSATLSPTSTATPTYSSTPTPAPTNTPLPTATATPPPLLLTPLPPSPHPAGNSGVHIAYRLSTPASVAIKIFDIAGEIVRELDPYQGILGPNEEFWDVKNTPGTPVSSGLYIAKISAQSPAGEVQVIFIKVAIAR